MPENYEQPVVMPLADPLKGSTAIPLDGDPRLSLTVAAGANHDYEADLAKVAKATGVPVDTVRSLPDEMKRQAQVNAIDFEKLQAQFPTTWKFMAKQDNANIGADDLTVMQRVEKGFGAFKRGIEKGSVQDELGELNYLAMQGTISPEQQARREKLKSDMRSLDAEGANDSGFAYFAGQTGYTGRQVVSSFREGGKGALAGATAGAATAAVVGQLGPQVATPEEIVTVPGAALIGGRVGFVGASALYNYKMEAGFAFDEFSDLRDLNGQPLPRDVVVGAAAAVGLINAGLETTGEIFIAKLFPGLDKLVAAGPKEMVMQMLTKPSIRAAFASAGKKWVTAASAEAITESLQELSTIVGRDLAQAASDQEFKDADRGADAKRVAEAGMDAFVGTMGVGIPGASYHSYREVRQAQKQQQNQVFIEALGQDASESKTLARLPEKYREFVASAKEGGPIQNVYIPAEQFQTFFQSQGVDPSEVAAQVGASNYNEALAAGTDVVIPIENYAEKLAGSQFHQGLMQDMRLHQGDLTAREYAQYAQEKAQREAELMEQAKQDVGAIQTPPLQAIKQDVLGQLIGSGYEQSTADAYATVYAKVISNLAERSGQDPQAVHDRYGLTINRPMPDVLTTDTRSEIGIDPLLDRLRAGNTPTDAQIFGMPLSEFIRGKGGIKVGGEMKDADRNRKAFQAKIVKDTGMDLSIAAEQAAEAGYFPGVEMADITDNEFLDALEADLAGNPVYSIHNADSDLMALRDTMNSLAEYLDALGVDLKAITNNADVRKLMEQASQDPNIGEDVQQFFQRVLGGEQQLLAPNGKPSNLSPELHAMVRTAEFKAWFGDWEKFATMQGGVWNDDKGEVSKAVDENGEPIVLYHGTDKGGFTAFNTPTGEKRGDLGIYLTPNRAMARTYVKRGLGKDLTRDEIIGADGERISGIYPVFANIRNPNETDFEGANWNGDRSHQWIVEVGGDQQFMPDGKGYFDEDQAKEFAEEFLSPEQKDEGLDGGEYARPADDHYESTDDVVRDARSNGNDGAIIRNVVDDGGGASSYASEPSDVFVALQDTQVKSIENFGSFNPEDPNIFRQGEQTDKRGYIQFGADRKFNIALLEKADLSTFLHETGHFYLEVLGDMAQIPEGGEQIKADYATLLKWFGVESRDQIETKHHEMFARANEAYLMEGNAPSAELRSIFQRFKSWLTMIYRELGRLNVELTPAVRKVFDRIYATNEEIEAAKHDVDMAPLFLDAAAAGMTEAEFSAYRSSVAQATESGKEALQTKLMREYMRERQAWWKEALGNVREEVTAEVNAQPVYKAFDALVAGKVGDEPVKLNKQALVDKYGADYIKRLPRGFQRIYTTKGGMDADAAAAYLGFESGDALVEALAGMRNRKELIEAEAQARMRERFGDTMTDGTILDEARIALHNEQRENVLMAELRALKRKQREVAPFVKVERDKAAAARRAAIGATATPPASAFRDAARGMIGQTALRNLEPFRYLQAERRAAKEAFAAMAKGDYQLAANAKQRELLNHYLYLEANRAKEDSDSILKTMRRFESGTTREQIGKAGADYLDQIDALLDRFEFARISLKAIDRRKALALWVAEQEAAGNEPAISASLLDESKRTNYKEASIDELRAVRDAVKNIEHLARLKNRLVTKQADIEFKDAIAELVAAAENNETRTALPLDLSAMTMRERAGDTVSRLDAMLLKTEQIVEWLDGGDVNGPWHTYLWNPIAAAQTAELDLTRELTQTIAQGLEAMPKAQRESMLDTFDIPGMGKVTRKFIVSMAMNMGNQQNIDKMMRGFGWDMGTIEGALAKLNADDLAFVQKTLDTIGGLWPQIAALEKRMTGLEPEQVQTHTFDVRDEQGNVMGTISGYFPLVYDPRKSEAGAKQETGNLGQLFEEGYVRATTPKGHTKARTEGFAAPLLLDFEQVVTQHLAKVVKDLTHREAIVAANKVLTNPQIRNVLQETLGTAYEKQMLPWLRSVVNDRNGGSTQGLSDFSRWMMSMRANVVAATMGFKVTTGIAQIVGISQSLDKVQGKYLSQALLEFLRHPIALTNQVRELSGEMRHRADTLDRDIRDQLRNLTGQNSTWAQAQKFAFHGIALADAMVAVPTWMGAYKQALDTGASEETARLEADAAVRMTQGSGGAKDLAAIQRNNELAKTLTMFYSYFNVLYNRMRDMGHQTQEIRDMPKFLARVFFTVMVPAVMGELILGRGPKEDEDPALWMIRKVLLYPLMSLPVLRDVASSMDSGFDYKFSPIATGMEKIYKLSQATAKLVEGDMEWTQYAVKAAETIGYVFGVAGTAQLAATGKYLWRVEEGEESPDNLAQLIFYAAMGKRKE